MQDLEQEMAVPDFWNDTDKASGILKELNGLKKHEERKNELEELHD